MSNAVSQAGYPASSYAKRRFKYRTRPLACRPAVCGADTCARGMKIGRNDPCPCGSGRKYKRCHLDRDRAQERVTAELGERMLHDFPTTQMAVAARKPT